MIDNSGKYKAFPIRPGTRQTCSLSPMVWLSGWTPSECNKIWNTDKGHKKVWFSFFKDKVTS